MDRKYEIGLDDVEFFAKQVDVIEVMHSAKKVFAKVQEAARETRTQDEAR